MDAAGVGFPTDLNIANMECNYIYSKECGEKIKSYFLMLLCLTEALSLCQPENSNSLFS